VNHFLSQASSVGFFSSVLGAGLARRTRRLWTDEEKRSICVQTAAPGVSVAQVARRYTVSANLIFKWLRDPKYRPEPGMDAAEAGLRFLPVEIVQEAAVAPKMPAAVNHIEIDLAGGHRMRINGSYDPEALARLIRGLTV
jgi:transposase